ncbi:MAG: glycosyltransferase family 4 protein [Nitrospiraceae bacterium]|nr:glycosyltransferase family 4 protein [Nitrospiraceae bacterium]
MKILHLVYDHMHNPWVGGGGAVRVYEICRRLASAGHEVTVVSGRFPGADGYHEGNLYYAFVGNSASYVLSTFSYAFKAAEFVRKQSNRFDIIVEDFAPWNPVFSALLTAKPVVLHVNHCEGAGILRRWWFLGVPFYLIEKWYPRLFRHVTALSEETRRKINMPGAFIVPAGINGAAFHAPERRGDQDDPLIVYVGRLHIRNKGLDVLLRAMKFIDRRLVLAGRGRDENRLKQMARELGLTNVEFEGFVSEDRKIALLNADCIFVLPSRFEGWGIVVLEAAARGRPAVVSDIPELSYAVDAGFAISSKSGDAKDLADKLNYLLGNESLRREMGLKARGYAECFIWDKIAAEYEQYLSGIAAASDLQKKTA